MGRQGDQVCERNQGWKIGHGKSLNELIMKCEFLGNMDAETRRWGSKPTSNTTGGEGISMLKAFILKYSSIVVNVEM